MERMNATGKPWHWHVTASTLDIQHTLHSKGVLPVEWVLLRIYRPGKVAVQLQRMFRLSRTMPGPAGLHWCCKQDGSMAMSSTLLSQDFALQSQCLLRPSGHTGQVMLRPFTLVWGAQVLFKLSEKSSLQNLLIPHHWKHLIIFKPLLCALLLCGSKFTTHGKELPY